MALSVEGRGADELPLELTGRAFFNLGFGTIVGIGWMVVLGEWLQTAGPLGAVAGFIAGGALMILVGLCYARLASVMPIAGGELAYARALYGPALQFAVGWGLLLVYVSVSSYLAVSAAWLLVVLAPASRGAILYTIAAEPVSAGSLVVASIGYGLLAALNGRGMQASARLQSGTTAAKFLIVAIVIAAAVTKGHFENLRPLVQRDSSGSFWTGLAGIAITSPWWFAGFNVAAQVVAERAPNTSLRAVRRAIVGSIVVAICFYCAIILSAALLMPWQALAKTELPLAAALSTGIAAPLLGRIVLIAGLIGILATWNGVLVAAVRVVMALAQIGVLPATLARLHSRHHSPVRAIVVVSFFGATGAFLGRAAILPAVRLGSIVFAAVYLMICVAVYRAGAGPEPAEGRHRWRDRLLPGVAFIGVAFLLLLAIEEPMRQKPATIPPEWVLLLAWTAFGVLLYGYALKRRRVITDARGSAALSLESPGEPSQ